MTEATWEGLRKSVIEKEMSKVGDEATASTTPTIRSDCSTSNIVGGSAYLEECITAQKSNVMAEQLE